MDNLIENCYILKMKMGQRIVELERNLIEANK